MLRGGARHGHREFEGGALLGRQVDPLDPSAHSLVPVPYERLAIDRSENDRGEGSAWVDREE